MATGQVIEWQSRGGPRSEPYGIVAAKEAGLRGGRAKGKKSLVGVAVEVDRRAAGQQRHEPLALPPGTRHLVARDGRLAEEPVHDPAERAFARVVAHDDDRLLVEAVDRR